ncbi:MAG: ATP-grasp domain-containing protein, partial [Waddliaceae bacterium]
MNIHEFQAKLILKEYGIPIPDFIAVGRPEDIEPAIDSLGVDAAVVKIQVHAGGRGKAGGVKLARSREEIIRRANELLGMKIINAQTGK